MQIEKDLYQMLMESLQCGVDSGGPDWLPGCHLRYCQECSECGFSNCKIRPVITAGKATGLYLDCGGKHEPIIC